MREARRLRRPALLLLAACLGALGLSGCSSREYNEYMRHHDPTPQQNANQHMEQMQQMSAMRRARVKS
jgi:hypothetical protein